MIILVAFVRQFGDDDGEYHYVNNIYDLVHVAGDVSRFGELESYPCLHFESYLGMLKKLATKSHYPL